MSRKLKLHVEELAIETFETTDAAEGAGTVHGHAPTLDGGETCNGGSTCWDSCDGVCDSYYCTPNTCGVYCWNPSNIPNTYAPTCYGLYTCAPQC
ncbi:MAG TPA: hypothetical protein VFR81_20915 [Longimicrobium sp.]|nr:hypothetical protein [Longimicrobium sp.]